MRNGLLIALALLLGLGSPAAWAQLSAAASPSVWAPRVQRLTVADGLPDSTIFSIAEDRRGFLWFGSTAGAIRYDGRRFRLLQHDPRDPASLPDNNASQVLIDADDVLWSGHWGGGLNRVRPGSEHVDTWRFEVGDPHSLASDYVQTLFRDREGRLWIGTGAGLMGFDAARQRPFRAYTGGEGAEAINDWRIWSIAQTRDGRLWLGTNAGLVSYDPASGTAQRHLLRGEGVAEHDLVRVVIADAKDRLWLATTAHFGRYEPGAARFTPIPSPPGAPRLTVNCALPHTGSQWWLGTWSGLWMFDSEQAALVPIGGSGQYQWFAADDVRDIHVDRSGMVWVATRYNGVAYAEIRPPRFRLYRQELTQLGEDLGSELVRAVYPGPGGLWLHTDGAVVLADIDRGSFEAVRATRGLRVGRYGQSAFDDRGGAWLATMLGPARLDLASGEMQLRPALLKAAGIVDPNLGLVMRDRQRRLWWGTQREGVLLSDLDGRLIRHFPAGNGKDGEMADLFADCFLEDSRGRVWMCSTNGLSMLEPGSTQFRVFRHNSRATDSLSHNRVHSLLEDQSGRVWIGTQVGLDLFDPERRRFIRHRLASSRRTPVEAMLESKPGTLWLASGGQLWQFDTQRRAVVGAPRETGEAGLAFFARAALRLDERRLLFGTNRGLLLFDPDRSDHEAFLPPVVITGAWIDRKAQPLSLDGHLPPQLVLEPGTRVLEFEFAALDFRSPASHQYAYRLEGFDADLVQAGNSNTATYTNLAPGRYRFVVSAAGADRGWNTDGASIDILVLPPWWGDWRIQLLLALLLASSATLGIRAYHGRQLSHQRELKRLVDERSQVIAQQQSRLAVQERMASLGTLTAGVAHEINNPTNFAFVGAQNLEADLAAFERDLTQLAGDDAEPEVIDFLHERFARLHEQVGTIREGAERIRTIVSQLRSFSRLDEAERKAVNVDDGVRSTLALVRTQYRDAVRFDTELGCSQPIDCWPAQLNQVFMNLIVNACQAIIQRHGRNSEQGHLIVRSRDLPDEVVIEFSDNGCGITPEHRDRIFEPFFTTKPVGEGTGLGLSISYGIVQRHGGRIEVESTPDLGTTMRVYLPHAAPAG